MGGRVDALHLSICKFHVSHQEGVLSKNDTENISAKTFKTGSDGFQNC